MRLEKLSIRQKFYALPILVATIFFITLGMNYNTITPIKSEWHGYLEHIAQRQNLLLDIKSQFGYGGAIHNFKNYVLRGTPKYFERINNGLGTLLKKIEQYKKLEGINKEELDALAAVQSVAQKYLAATDIVQKMHKGGSSPKEIDAAVKISDSPALKAFDVLTQQYQEMTEHSTQKMEESIAYTLTISSASLLVALLLIIGALIFLGRSILGPIDDLRRLIIKAEKDSDLTVSSDLDSSDEIGQTAQAFNKMLDKFRAIVGEVVGSSTHLTSAVDKLTTVTELNSEGVTKQQSETDQAATAMNEMATTVQEVSRSASEAATAAQNADKESANGKRVVTQTIDAIDNLAHGVENAAQVIQKVQEDADNIGSVLDVIRGIADQTNLLALNAAIEAARAGEQGRGFAVVADEVRTLAQRTQESTQEIQAMIEKLQVGTGQAVQVMDEGQTQAQNSVQQAAQAGVSLDAITQAVATINEMNTQIASASEEQSVVAGEIDQNMVMISQVAEHNAENSNELTSTNDELNQLALNLQAMVVQFKV